MLKKLLCSVCFLALLIGVVAMGCNYDNIRHFLGWGDVHDHDDEPLSTSGAGEPVMEIAFSPIAARNIGLDESTIVKLEAVEFFKSITIPAVVTERPGWSVMTVPSTVSGVITRIYQESGVSVQSGQPLFDIMLNQQELIKGQSEYLAMLKKLEINAAEIQRLGGIDETVIPKTWRDKQYEKMQLELELETQKISLLLQGLTEDDITESLKNKGEIIRTRTIYAPQTAGNETECTDYTVDKLFVTVGKNVEVGESLCQLSDLCELSIEGMVFATNESIINRALDNKLRVNAVFEGNDGFRQRVDDLVIRSIDNRIDPSSGTLFCYVDLENESTSYEIPAKHGTDSRRYIQWRFKPGQRCELNVEYESLPNCFVLPVDAITYDIQEPVVFEWVGNEEVGNEGDRKIWRKRPVHIIFRTKDSIAIANDGSVFPEAKIATKGATLILAALENANQKKIGGSGGIQHGDHIH